MAKEDPKQSSKGLVVKTPAVMIGPKSERSVVSLSPTLTTTKQRAPRAKIIKSEPLKLKASAGPPPLIDVLYPNGQDLGALLGKDGKHEKNITLKAGAAFTLVNTVTFTDGPYEGLQAILLRPAKTFPFLKLDILIRARVNRFYLAQEGLVNNPIIFDGRRTNKVPYAKTYANGSKNRVGLLAACKTINQEAVPLLYAHTLRFESTSQLLEFLRATDPCIRPQLRDIEIQSFVKTTSRMAMSFLAEARFLTRLHIDSGISTEGDPGKAARMFYAEAYKFLEAMGSTNRTKTLMKKVVKTKMESHSYEDGGNEMVYEEPEQEETIQIDGLHVLSFGTTAFTRKDDNKKAKPWPGDLVAEFEEQLRAKMK